MRDPGTLRANETLAQLAEDVAFRRVARTTSQRAARRSGLDTDDVHQVFWLQLCVLHARGRWPFGPHSAELRRRLASGELAGLAAIVSHEAVRQLLRGAPREHTAGERLELVVQPECPAARAYVERETLLDTLSETRRAVQSQKLRLAIAEKLLDVGEEHGGPSAETLASRLALDSEELRRSRTRRQALRRGARRSRAAHSAWRRVQNTFHTNLCRARAALAAG